MKIGAMYVDKHPVTNAQYATYMAASHYLPSDTANWLKENFHQNRARGPKSGWESKPVTYVSLEDARHYCSFNNKRLPHAYEWQYFAQGTDGRRYPWGNEDNLTYTPPVNNNWTNTQGPVPLHGGRSARAAPLESLHGSCSTRAAPMGGRRSFLY